jgi:hypothetical protein
MKARRIKVFPPSEEATLYYSIKPFDMSHHPG